MGYEFDDNGRYIGWSDLFDTSSIETLKASEYLPIPNGVTYVKSSEGLDITEDIQKISSVKSKPAQIRLYADLLEKIQDIKSNNKKQVLLNWNESIPEELGNEVLSNLNKHSQTYLSPMMIEKCLKNSVSSSITNIIQNLRNMDQAYSPIEMDKVRKAAEQNPKNKSDRMTLMNPLTKFLMQEQNMVGKGVIGIAAVGEKVFFNVSHYWNEGLRSRNQKWIKNMQFSQSFSRIQNRSKGMPERVTKTTIANVNFENFEDMRQKFIQLGEVDTALRQRWMITDYDVNNKTERWRNYSRELTEIARQAQYSSVYADDLISQLLSAATDNAKELILAKINAGTNLARCYLHLIMMGFDINDIAKFMTSPAVSVVNSLLDVNMFDEYMTDNTVFNVIKILKGQFPINKFFFGSVFVDGEYESISNEAFKKIKGNLQTVLQDLGYTQKNRKGEDVPIMYKYLNQIVEDYFYERLTGRITKSLIEFTNGELQMSNQINVALAAFSDYIDNVVDRIKSSGSTVTEFNTDLEEFEKVFQLATETSTLGSVFLGLNQGIGTSKYEILDKIYKIQKAVSDREKIFGISEEVFASPESMAMLIENIRNNNPFLEQEDIVNGLTKAKELGIINNFDFIKWLENADGYRAATSDYYNLIKGTWNIFDIVQRLPHFNSIFQIFRTVVTMDSALIKKSYMLNKMVKNIFGNTTYLDEQTVNKLLDYVDDLLISKWINDHDFKFPIFDGDSTYKYNWKEVQYKGENPSSIIINSESTRGTFKKLIEERLIPNLRQGFYYDENGNRITIRKGNKFIENLILDIDNDGRSYLKLNLDMQNTSATAANESRYQECLSDFVKLKNYKLNGISLTDWIMLYNLIVNKNKFGSDRLTTLFGQFIDIIKEDSLIKTFLKDIGKIDYNQFQDPDTIEDLIEMGYNRDDALYRIAPIISKAQEMNTNSEMVREYQEGRPIIGRKPNKFADYFVYEEILPNSTELNLDDNQSSIDKIIRLQNWMKHGTLQMPFANKRSSVITNLSSKNQELVYSALQSYIQSGIIEIYTENC